MKQFIITVLSVLFLSGWAEAQLVNPVSWTFSHKENEQQSFQLQFNASIEKHWHLYSEKPMETGPIATSVHFDEPVGYQLEGSFNASSKPTPVFDKNFNMDVEYFSNKVTFIQNILLLTNDSVAVTGYVEFMCCDDETCLLPTQVPFSFKLVKSKEVPASLTENGTVSQVENQSETFVTAQEQAVSSSEPNQNSSTEDNIGRKSMLVFLLLAFGAGLAAIITPCVFPMIPMTVSFFMRGSQGRGGALKTAFYFGGSIVLIYTILGGLFTIGIFGPNAGSILSTHWIPNTLFFVLFFIFALSFFGLFELVLPGSLANKTDAKAEKGGLIGAFFMALTTVIVSFSCTGPFIGYLIIEAVQGGGLRPLLGMFVFGLAFATPFTLLAIFPSALKKLPKSGGWLNSVKVVFAFILLAFGLKFLSNIDQVYGFNLLSRELYLSIWIVIFILLGMYLLGKLKFSHDSELKHIGVGRLLLALVSFVFSLYLFTGLLGNPLTPVSSLIPPASVYTQLHTQNSEGGQTTNPVPACGPSKYADKLHLPYGLSGYFDYQQGIDCASEQQKPVFLVFKGHACANCKKMENTVWNDPEILEMLKDDFVIVALYADDRSALPEVEWKTSEVDGKLLKTMGMVNLDLLMSKYNKNTIPYHVVIKPDGTQFQLATTFDRKVFKTFLEQGISE